MKKIIFLAAAALLAAACEQPRTKQSRTLEAKPASLAFEAADNAPRTVTVTARNVAWEVSVDETAASWLEATDSVRADKFIELVKRHTEFNEFSASLLNEFVEKIIVHEATKVNGVRDGIWREN